MSLYLKMRQMGHYFALTSRHRIDYITSLCYYNIVMLNNKTGYTEALADWQEKIDNSALSVAPSLGRMAILVPYDSTFDSLREPDELFPQIANLSYQFADRLQESGKEVDVAINAHLLDFERTLTDPNTSDIFVVGHGNISSVQIERGDRHNRLDWRDISAFADHLKTGLFMQYMCGRLTRRLNVPLGLFAVDNHSHVLAAVGRQITPSEVAGNPDGSLSPITDKQRMEYEDVLVALPRQDVVPPPRIQHAIGAIAGKTKRHRN